MSVTVPAAPLIIQSSTTAIGVAAFSGSQMGPVITWLCAVVHISPAPSDTVAAIVGALIVTGVHYGLTNYLGRPPTVPLTSKDKETAS